MVRLRRTARKSSQSRSRSPRSRPPPTAAESAEGQAEEGRGYVRRSTRAARASTAYDPAAEAARPQLASAAATTASGRRAGSPSPAAPAQRRRSGAARATAPAPAPAPAPVQAVGAPAWQTLGVLVACCAVAVLAVRCAPADAKAQLLGYLRSNSVPRWHYLLAVFAGVLLLIPSTPIETLGGLLYANPTHDLTALQPACVALIGTQTATCDMLELWLLSSLAKLTANVFSVLIARHLARGLVERYLLPRYPILQAASALAEEEPLKTTLFIRGSMVPLAVKNYGCGVLKVPYWCIACGSLVFGPLYGFQNFLMGAEARRLGEDSVAAGGGGGKSVEMMVLGYVAQLALVMAVVKRVQGRIKEMAAAA